MTVYAGDVRPGEFFMTPDHELRKVYRVAPDRLGRTHVWFQRKSAVHPNRPLLFGHGPGDAPTVEDFVAQCERRLTWNEVDGLRGRGILLTGE